MSNADIEIVGPGEKALITELYNQVFRPAKTADFFSRRFEGRVAHVLLNRRDTNLLWWFRADRAVSAGWRPAD